jgi:hypothetical protein
MSNSAWSPSHSLASRSGPPGGRVILPMSSGVDILPNTLARITSRPFNAPFMPDLMVIGGCPGDWIIHGILIGNRSCLLRSIPGDAFSHATLPPGVNFITCAVGMDLSMDVTYVGQGSAPFICGVLGAAAIHGQPAIAPISPSVAKKVGRPPASSSPSASIDPRRLSAPLPAGVPRPAIGWDPYGDD